MPRPFVRFISKLEELLTYTRTATVRKIRTVRRKMRIARAVKLSREQYTQFRVMALYFCNDCFIVLYNILMGSCGMIRC